MGNGERHCPGPARTRGISGIGAVEWSVERRQLVCEPEVEPNPTGSHRVGVAAGGLADHLLRMVKARHGSVGHLSGCLADRDAWPEADLQDSVGRLELEK